MVDRNELTKPESTKCQYQGVLFIAYGDKIAAIAMVSIYTARPSSSAITKQYEGFRIPRTRA